LAGAATVLGGAKMAVRSAAGPGGGEMARAGRAGANGLGEAPLPAAGPRPPLVVAVPAGGQYGRTNEQLRGAIERALPAVAQEAGGRFRLEMLDLALPAPAPRTFRSQAYDVAPLIGSGAPPDLLVLTGLDDSWWVPEALVAASSIRFLRPVSEAEPRAERTLAVDELLPASLSVCRHHGALLGVPLLTAPMLLFYDRQRFEQAGVREPTDGWGWAQFLDAARRLTHDPGDAAASSCGAGLAPADQYGFWPDFGARVPLALIWQAGGEVVDAAGKRARLTQPEVLEALELYAQLWGKRAGSDGRAVCPPLTPTGGREWGPEGFRYGGRWWFAMGAALAYGDFSTWRRPAWQAPLDEPEWPVAMARLPHGKRRASVLNVCATVSVCQKTRDAGLAVGALAALVEQVSSQTVLSARRPTPAALRALEPRLSPELAQVLSATFAESRTLALGDLQKGGDVNQAVLEAVESIRSGWRSPAEAAQRANDVVQRRLDGMPAGRS
jgi:hypothetical protein